MYISAMVKTWYSNVQYIILIVLMVIHHTTGIQKHHGYVNSQGPPMISSPHF